MLRPVCSFLGYKGFMKVFVPFDESILGCLKLDIGMAINGMKPIIKMALSMANTLLFIVMVKNRMKVKLLKLESMMILGIKG
jgi:hypothetical protein